MNEYLQIRAWLEGIDPAVRCLVGLITILGFLAGGHGGHMRRRP